MIVSGGVIKILNLINPIILLLELLGVINQIKTMKLEKSKNKVVCTLFKQPLTNNMIYGGIFEKMDKLLELFESN